MKNNLKKAKIMLNFTIIIKLNVRKSEILCFKSASEGIVRGEEEDTKRR